MGASLIHDLYANAGCRIGRGRGERRLAQLELHWLYTYAGTRSRAGPAHRAAAVMFISVAE